MLVRKWLISCQAKSHEEPNLRLDILLGQPQIGAIRLLALERVVRRERRRTMEDKGISDRKPDPARMEALKSLPRELMLSLTKEEVNAFLYEDVWPESLGEKLKNYLV